MDAFSITRNLSTNGEINLYVKKSIRKNGTSTTISIGKIGKLSSFKGTDEEINKQILDKANEIYKKWSEENSLKATVEFSLDDEVTENEDVSLGYYYIFWALNKLNLIDKLNNLKGESKSKYNFNLAKISKILISSQIINPGSKRHTYLSSDKEYIDNIKLHQIYRALDVLASHADEINAYSYKKVKEALNINSKIYYYDCTNFYYTQGSDGELLTMKKSKEGIFAPLIQLGLLIDEWGVLIGMLVFEGNKNEQPTLKEQLEKIKGKIDISNIVVCTDAGLCSFSNKMLLSNNGRAYITTQPIKGKTVSQKIKDWVIEDSDFKDSNGNKVSINSLKDAYYYAVENNDEKTISKILNKTVYKDLWFSLNIKKKIVKNSDGNRKKYEIKDIKDIAKENFQNTDENIEYIVTYDNANGVEASKCKGDKIYTRLLVSFSLKYYLHDIKKLEDTIDKINSLKGKNIDFSSASKEIKAYAVITHTTKDGELADNSIISINEETVKEERKYAGFYVQATNLGDSSIEIYKTSRMRWQIEYCFRTMKLNLNCRPIYLTNTNHIKGHFVIIFLALQTIRFMMYKLYKTAGYKNNVLGRSDEETDITIDKVLDELRNMHGKKFHAKEGYDFIHGTIKNELNTLMTKAFGFSLAKQVIKIKELENKVKGI